MSIVIFIIVLVVLILVHEFGHFVAAKLSGMRVDEFGLGYPPRLWGVRRGETIYSINALPFGGFVKIYGEDPPPGGVGQAGPRAFGAKPRILQAITLVAGVLMNLLFAYLLLVVALMAGTPRALAPEEIAQAKNVSLAIASTLPGSPGALAGLEPADLLVSAKDAEGQWSGASGEEFTKFVAASKGEPITLTVSRNNTPLSINAIATQGIVASDPTRYALGLSIAPVGVIPLSFTEAVAEGLRLTYGVVIETTKGLAHFFVGIFTLRADLSQVAGPVGIANAVGSASEAGWGELLSLAAIISINLAIINLIPVPALDGGRLLFVIIESIIRRPIKPVVAQTVNAVGFALLILLMVVVTLHDVYKLVG